MMTIVALLLLKFGVYRMKDEPPWKELLQILGSGLAVAFLEESMFRAAILGSFRRSMGPWTSLAAVSASRAPSRVSACAATIPPLSLLPAYRCHRRLCLAPTGKVSKS